MLDRFMNTSIRTKIIISLYICIALMFVALALVLLIQGENQQRSTIISNGLDTLEVANLLIEKEQQYLYGIAEYYSISPIIQTLLSSQEAVSSEDLQEAMKVGRSRMYLLNIAFYNLNGDVVEHMTIDNSKGPVNQLSLETPRPFDEIITGKKAFVWEFIDAGDTVMFQQDNSPKLCLWYLIKNTKNLRPIGAIAISVDSRKLITAEKIPTRLYNTLVVLDGSGREVFNNHPSYSPEARQQLRSLSHARDKGHDVISLDGQKYRVIFTRISQSDIVSYQILPYTRFTLNLYTLSLQSVTGIALCTVLLLPLLIFITNTLTKPLAKLSESMVRFSEGDFDTQVAFRHQDEIGRLGQVFNKMVTDQKTLIEQTYVLELKEKEAELTTLQAQINPHFLYNMINTIYWAAQKKGDEEVADLAYSMGQVFRISLNRGKRMISVCQEKDLILYYLTLQQRRFGERVSHDIRFDDDTLDLFIPKLIIQPLIENSIVHGAETGSTPVHITVDARLSGDQGRLIILVTDDGQGIPEELLRRLPDNPPESESGMSSRFALRNINDRLRLSFGEDYVFRIHSVYGEGVQIRIELPAISEDIS